MAFVFWLACAWVVYAFAGYAAALRCIAWLRTRPVKRGDVTAPVSVIVTVHNGAGSIREKLENLLHQDHPFGPLELVVADDGSDDGTDRIVREEFGTRGVRLVRLERRGGKERAQKEAIAKSSGEILVFTDVGTRLDKHGIATIVRSFADPGVGAVSSEDRLLGADGATTEGEGGYVGYEMGLRRLESKVGSLVGLSGSFFAARRAVCADFSDRLASDFRTALRAVRLGLRAVVDEQAIGHYRDVARGTREFDRKVRTVIRGMTVLFAEASLLNPLRYGLFSWQLASHKLARWLVPFAMLAALGASAALASGSRFFAGALVLQVAGYLVAIVTVVLPAAVPVGPLRGLRYLVEVNAAIVVAWARYLQGERIVTWRPSTR